MPIETKCEVRCNTCGRSRTGVIRYHLARVADGIFVKNNSFATLGTPHYLSPYGPIVILAEVSEHWLITNDGTVLCSQCVDKDPVQTP